MKVFVSQKTTKVWVHTVKMVPQESFGEEPPGKGKGRSGGDGGKIERKLSEVNTRPMSRGQNELKSTFKVTVGDVISIGGRF